MLRLGGAVAQLMSMSVRVTMVLKEKCKKADLAAGRGEVRSDFPVLPPKTQKPSAQSPDTGRGVHARSWRANRDVDVRR